MYSPTIRIRRRRRLRLSRWRGSVVIVVVVGIGIVFDGVVVVGNHAVVHVGNHAVTHADVGRRARRQRVRERRPRRLPIRW
jgi:predicted anti-sigma-YlaC factor YlaD